MVFDRRVLIVRDHDLRHRLRRRVRVLRRCRRGRPLRRRGVRPGGDPLVELLRYRHVLLLVAHDDRGLELHLPREMRIAGVIDAAVAAIVVVVNAADTVVRDVLVVVGCRR